MVAPAEPDRGLARNGRAVCNRCVARDSAAGSRQRTDTGPATERQEFWGGADLERGGTDLSRRSRQTWRGAASRGYVRGAASAPAVGAAWCNGLRAARIIKSNNPRRWRWVRLRPDRHGPQPTGFKSDEEWHGWVWTAESGQSSPDCPGRKAERAAQFWYWPRPREGLTGVILSKFG